MNISRMILAFLFGLAVSAGIASAQTAKPQDGLESPASPAQPAGQSPSQELKSQDKSGPADDDEIIIIPGLRVGKSQLQQPQQPKEAEVTPQMLESLYKVIWLKISQEYQDPSKLRDWNQWQNKFDGKLKTEADLDSAIREMVGSLKDRWTKYYSPVEIAAQKKAAEDGLVDAGMMLRKHSDNDWHIDGMQFHTPAAMSTLREGDIIRSLNGKSLASQNETEVKNLLTGKVGDKISVGAFYDGAEHEVELTLREKGLLEDAITAGLMPGNIAYVRLPTFISKEIVQAFAHTLSQLYQGSGGKINGIILDLRYNGGGRFDMALAVSSMFLENGTITRATTRSHRNITETQHKVIPVPEYLDAMMEKMNSEYVHFLATVPLVVLTNGSTASASEITTGALQDNGRAFVIGVKTFGKAVGFTDVPMPNGGVIQVTNLTYLTPKGTNIADKGIDPSQVVELPRGQEVFGDNDEQLKAAQAYLLNVVAERSKQLSEAQDLSKQPLIVAKAAGEEPALIRPFHVLLVLAGVLSVTVLLLIIVRKRNKRRRMLQQLQQV